MPICFLETEHEVDRCQCSTGKRNLLAVVSQLESIVLAEKQLELGMNIALIAYVAVFMKH